MVSLWAIWKSGFSSWDARRIHVFHTDGWPSPFAKGTSLFIGTQEEGTAVQTAFHVAPRGLMDGGESYSRLIVTVKSDWYFFFWSPFWGGELGLSVYLCIYLCIFNGGAVDWTRDLVCAVHVLFHGAVPAPITCLLIKELLWPPPQSWS